MRDMFKWLLPALALSGCTTDPYSLAWQDSFSLYQEDIETRSLTEQMAMYYSTQWPPYVYGPGYAFPPYPDYYYQELFYGVAGLYGPPYGGPYGSVGYGYFPGPWYVTGGGIYVHRTHPYPSHPRPGTPWANAGATPAHAVPHTGHRTHPSGSSRSRGRR